MTRRLAAALAALLVFAACSSGSDEPSSSSSTTAAAGDESAYVDAVYDGLLTEAPPVSKDDLRCVAQAIVDAAHRTCPYSKATRGNVDVALSLG